MVSGETFREMILSGYQHRCTECIGWIFHEFRECIFQGSSSLEERNHRRDGGFVVDEFCVCDEPSRVLTSNEARRVECVDIIEKGKMRGWELAHREK